MNNSIINSIVSNDSRAGNLLSALENDYIKRINELQTQRKNPPAQQNTTSNPNDDVFTTYQKEVKNKHSAAYKITAGVATAFLLGGGGMIFGRGHYRVLRANIKDNLAILLKKDQNKELTRLETAKAIFDFGLEFLFNFDKGKDFTFLKTIKSLGAPGKKLAEWSKFSEYFLRKLRLERHWDGVVVQAEKVEKLAETHNLTKLKELLNNKPFHELKNNLNDRVTSHKNDAKGLAATFESNYFPEGKIWQPVFYKNLVKCVKKSFADIKNEGDLILSKWQSKKDEGVEKIAEKMKSGIDSTKNVSQIIKKLEIKAKNAPDEVKPEINLLIEKYKNARDFEVDNYAARLRDLELGGGATELLIPTVFGGILAKNTKKGNSIEERVDNFIKGGGIGYIGGLSAWVVISMMIGLTGPVGMAAGLATGVMLDVAGKTVHKSNKKRKEFLKANAQPVAAPH